MKVYISGPMTGKEDFNFPAFFDAESKLKENGFVPVNPARSRACKKFLSTVINKTNDLIKEKEALYNQGLKKCNNCKKIKEITRFYKNKNLKLGLDSQCIDCVKQYKKENRKQIYKKAQEYQVKHKEHLATLRKKYREENRNKIFIQRHKFRNSNCTDLCKVEKINNKDPRYEAKSTNDFVVIKCYYCKKEYIPINIEVQHFISAKDGMKNIYCSDSCKENCIGFALKSTRCVDPRSTVYVEKSTKDKVRDCQTDHLKQLQIDEVDYNYCEKCGEEVYTVELHHTLEVAKFGLEAVNSAGHLLICNDCHKEFNLQCRN